MNPEFVQQWVRRQRLLALPILCLVLTAAADAPGAAKVLVYGNSISAAYGIQRQAGWVALLEQRLQAHDPEHRVINASVSGETTSGGLARLPSTLATHAPDLLILELGGNDGLRGYPVTTIADNLAGMIRLARLAGCQVLLVPMQIPPSYGQRYVRAFERIFADVAARESAPLAASFIDSVALEPGLMQDDGVHPNAAAQPRLLDALWPEIRALLQL